jgi:hypothetical protein
VHPFNSLRSACNLVILAGCDLAALVFLQLSLVYLIENASKYRNIDCFYLPRRTISQ